MTQPRLISKDKSTYPTQAQICRAIDAVKKSGVRVGGVEIRPDGTISVLPAMGEVIDPNKEAWFGEN